MRPSILFPLFTEITALRGIGPRLAPLYKRLCGQYIVDLLWHIPVGTIDRGYSPKLKHAERDRIATLKINVIEHIPPGRRSLPYRIVGADDTDQIYINHFNVKGDYLEKIYPVGRAVVISGLLERYRNEWCMSHPDYAVPPERIAEIPRIEPVYPLTQGISGKMMRKAVGLALSRLPELPEWHDPSLMERESWPSWNPAVKAIHNPEMTNNDFLSKKRLAYDELLADQLALAVIRRYHQGLDGRKIAGDGSLQKKLKQSLPFTLTDGQIQSLKEISEDMAAPKRMLRLLQGDVGSGKTIVALFAMLQAIESGMQTALMVPTEILAKQHHARLNAFLEPLGIEAGLLIGKSKNKERQIALDGLADGSLKIVIGTHALFQDDIKFKNLGLAVVDEQHRFGVQQRLKLSDKGRGVDILVMTATPIPRTLTLTAYGDMDVSRLMDKPTGRKPIDTKLIDLSRIEEVIAGIERQIENGSQIYWICPLVEESEKIDLAAATARAEMLQKKMGKKKIGLVHGKMAADEKDKTMAAFNAGEIKLLVATTVVEVGMDVPNATVMIVEHAERFGLAQLHQLRGRVGRSEAKSTCLLLYLSPLSEMAKSRLKMLRETEDGFLIAEEDLRLRGPGEILGTRQSGLQEFRIADLSSDRELLKMAHDDAGLILARDSDLTSPRGKACRILLYLFAKDAAVKLFRSG
ncbi:MAG: ATP-dependent DNA helicase RecG [Alphaproteobacteria bacterium]|nr:ATP-dependent DNA helicase RecG [Alphaproteobacteria bacterium]